MNETEKLKRTLESIDGAINGLLMLVFEDFREVTNIIKRKSHDAHFRNQVMHVLMKELQYYDILHQKVNHMKIVHGWIQQDINSDSRQNGCEAATNLIRLNQLQYQFSIASFIKAVDTIQSVLDDQQGSYQMMITRTEQIFLHDNLIQAANRLINTAFSEMVLITQGWEALKVCGKLDAFGALYSMESERHVLEAYLNKPSIELDEIANRFSSVGENADIDLF